MRFLILAAAFSTALYGQGGSVITQGGLASGIYDFPSSGSWCTVSLPNTVRLCGNGNGLYFSENGGALTRIGGGGGGGTVTSIGLAGTGGQIVVTGASPITGSGSWTLSLANPLSINGAPVPSSALFLGTNGSAQFTPLTAAQATAALNPFSSSLQGLTPASGGGTANFLRADGTWVAPTGSGTVSSISTTGPISGGPITGVGTLSCPTCIVATPNPGAGVAHFAGSTQTITSSAVDLASEVTGNLAVSHFNSGSGASSATVWRGDGTWAAVNATQVNGAAVPASALFLGSNGSSQLTALTAAQATAALNLFSTSLQGLAPASGGGTTNFLRADGTWATPSGSAVSGTANQIDVSGSVISIDPILQLPGTLQGTVLTPTVGSASELTSILWTCGSNDILSSPTFSNANCHQLEYYPNMGQQDYDNTAKRTLIGLKVFEESMAAGQRNGIAATVLAQGVGDATGMAVQVTGGSPNSGGDEDTQGFRAQVSGDNTAPQRTLAALPVQSTCGSGGLTLSGPVSPATSPQTVTVTGSTAGCVIGDRVVINRQAPVKGSSTEEMVALTGVAGGSISAKFDQSHSPGVSVTAATKLDCGSFNCTAIFGQFRWVLRTAHDFATGAAAISNLTVTGIGTGWTSTSFGGDAVEPGFISKDGDSNGALRSWFPISSVDSTTSITLAYTYNGLSAASGAYKASCGAVILGFDPPVTPTNNGQIFYVDTPPGVGCAWTAGDVVEMTAPIAGSYTGYKAILSSYLGGNPKAVSGFVANNEGDYEGRDGVRIFANASPYADPSTPGFEGALTVASPVEYGVVFQRGVANQMLVSKTYNGFGAAIEWSAQTGSGSAKIVPDTSTGTLLITTETGSLKLINHGNANQNATLDTGLISGGNPVFRFPATGGTLCTTASCGSTVTCQTGLGDGVNAIPAGTYPLSDCLNAFGSTWTITSIRCFTDNNGTSTLNATNSSNTGLLTGALTCTNAFASGTQSGTTTLAANDFTKFSFVSDGTSTQTTWVITGTK